MWSEPNCRKVPTILKMFGKKIAMIEPNFRKNIRFEKSEFFMRIGPNCGKIPRI